MNHEEPQEARILQITNVGELWAGKTKPIYLWGHSEGSLIVQAIEALVHLAEQRVPLLTLSVLERNVVILRR